MPRSGFHTLLPLPVSAQPRPGHLTLDATTTVSQGADLWSVVEPWRHAVSQATGLPLAAGDGVPAGRSAIEFALDPVSGIPPEGYLVEITPERATVSARDRAGIGHATQTLRQLLGADAYRRAAAPGGSTRIWRPSSPWSLPCGSIEDWPRFTWRGCMLDVARHFLPKADVLRFVDLMTAHKLNVLHLHLTDDQGWRVPIARYPRLVEVGAWRTESTVGHPVGERTDGRPHGGYYTSADLAEIVGYAAARGVRVIPEIDVPGHAHAAIAAYPELGNTGVALPVWTSWGVDENVLNAEESTVGFYRDVFDELLAIFPSDVIGIGGDEVPTVQWRDSARAAERAAELGLLGVEGLHGWFIEQIAAHLAKQGRRAFGWDEIAETRDLPDNAIVASWRGEAVGIAAARAGRDVVMCPERPLYFDHRQSDGADEPIPVGYLNTLDDVYHYRPVPAQLSAAEATRVLGAQAQVWTEHLDSARSIDYAAFPRLAAFAEVLWGTATDDVDAFRTRMADHHLPRLDALGVEYRPLSGPHPWQTRPGVVGHTRG